MVSQKPTRSSSLLEDVDVLAGFVHAQSESAHSSGRGDAREAIAACATGFRSLLSFGLACVTQNTYPPLTRCWEEVDDLFASDHMLDDGLFVHSWVLMDFPFGPQRETALDYFEASLVAGACEPSVRRFISAARASRLGLHQDILRTKQTARFRELFSGKVTDAVPPADTYETGDILIARLMTYGGFSFFFTRPKRFSKEAKPYIEDMLLETFSYLAEETSCLEASNAQFERFMKLAGPYWMSCVTRNHDVPTLYPDHYRSYLDDARAEPPKVSRCRADGG